MYYKEILKRSFFLTFCLFLIFTATFSFSGEVYDPLSVYLTWKKSPETTMSIQWVSKKNEVNDLVYYRPLNSSGFDTCLPFSQKLGSHVNMPEGQPYLIHQVELTDLQPGTAYTFKITENGKLYKFKTIPASLTKLRFVEGGDVYHGTVDVLEETNLQAAKLSPDFAVIGGDIAYAADSSHGVFPENFQNWLNFLITWKITMVTPDGFMIPIIPTIGNHETAGGYGKTPAAAPFFYALFPMPGIQGYNVLDFGNYMSIILLDSGHTHPIGGKQADWLRDTLKSRTHVPYKFAVYHVPAYPSVRSYSGEISEYIRKHWVPLFDTFSLRAGFEHHDHAYKRTFPLKNHKAHEKGVIYLGDGAWAVSNPRKQRRLTPYIAKSVASRHFILVTLTEEGVKYEAFNEKGEIIDQYGQNK